MQFQVVKEQFEDDLALVEILKADPIDSSQFSSIADDIWTICSSMRYDKRYAAVSRRMVIELDTNNYLVCVIIVVMVSLPMLSGAMSTAHDAGAFDRLCILLRSLSL